MKRSTFSLAVLFSAISIQAAYAANTVNFTGELVAQTCSASAGDKSQTVHLPKVSVSQLSAKGDVAAQTGFNIELTGCTNATGTAKAVFASGSGVRPGVGTLLNTSKDAGAAKNVDLQLVDAVNGKSIKAGDFSQVDSTTAMTISGSAITLPYAVQYYATDVGATAGPINASVTYDISYQ
ncbi:fimbrial protein [Pseudomonas protegens]|uniref:fimbrial protein n=1 Tax=Pseudomonas protegens TaxID=380021 RepID=UPI000F4C6AAC|nr:fimbrial protein [Pseudomonas protegens]